MINWIQSLFGRKSTGILTNTEIFDALAYTDLSIEPLGLGQVQPASVDLRLDGEWKVYRSEDESSSIIDSKIEMYDGIHTNVTGDSIVVNPGDFVLGSTMEAVNLPPDIYGKIAGRSSVGRLGIEVHKTAGVIDPGWCGDITLEITNDMPHPVRLHKGQRVCQITLHQLNKDAEPAYGEKEDSKYQNQSGPTVSRIHDDR